MISKWAVVIFGTVLDKNQRTYMRSGLSVEANPLWNESHRKHAGTVELL